MHIVKNTEKNFDATQYKNQFQKEKYDRIIVNVPKGQKKRIQIMLCKRTIIQWYYKLDFCR